MSSTLRAVAVASCTALLVAGVASSAGASGSAASSGLTISPDFGLVNSTITVRGSGFLTGDTVTIGHSSAQPATVVSPTRLTAVVPSDATTGLVRVDEGATTVVGPLFTLQQATAGSSALSTRKLTFTHDLLVRGVETVTGSSVPVAGEEAVLQHRLAGTDSWHTARGTHVKSTGRAGRVGWKVEPSANGRYRVYFRQSHAYAGLTTASHGVRVLPFLKLQSLHTALELSTSQIAGSIHPRLGGRVYLQQRLGHSWKTVKHTQIEGGRFSFSITPTTLGRLQYRVIRHTDSTHGHATSRTLHVAVVHRTLSLGSSGRDVRTLQNRLAHLHYDIGPRNGSYGWDTVHAVTAFEKVNGLVKDGETGPKVRAALNHPRVPHLRYPYPSEHYSVEVNLSKEVLLIARNGKVWRILDTSTAGGYLYTNSEGGTSRAITPTGHFSIQYKITGWHKSSLGELYYPSYFTDNGYAIHGEGNGNDSGEVPPYANSHGCVRITNDAVLRYYYHVFTVGTSVWIYH
jgi:N-acetylmuramoyl-L-alanine amidase